MNGNNTITVFIDGEYVTKELIQRQNGFDPMTGAPVTETVVHNGFDEMTGEPVYVTVEQNGFDPMTGQPVYSIPSSKGQEGAQASETAFGGNTSYAMDDASSYYNGDSAGTPAEGKKEGRAKGNKLVVILAALVGVVVLAGLIFGIAVSAMAGPELAVINAFNKTIKNDSIGKSVMAFAEILDSNAVTGEYKLSIEDVDVKGTTTVNVNKGQIGSTVNVDARGFDESIQFYYDEERVQVAIPGCYNKTIEYDCTKDNDGDVVKMLMSETRGDMDDLNVLISGFSRIMQQKSKFKKAYAKELFAIRDSFQVEKLEAESFEVDGKDRKCKGYQFTIDKHLLKDIKAATENAQEKAYGEEIDKMEKALAHLTGEDSILDEPYEEAFGVLEGFKSVDIEVFIYKGQIAAIRSSDLGKLKIEFRGGDTRTSEIVVKVGGQTLLKKESSIKNKVEKGTVSMMGEEIDYSYNMSNGKFEIDQMDDLEIVFLVKGKKATVSTEIAALGLDVSAEISKGGSAKPIKGDVVDLGSMDESDAKDILDELGQEALQALSMGTMGGSMEAPSRNDAAESMPAEYGDDWGE